MGSDLGVWLTATTIFKPIQGSDSSVVVVDAAAYALDSSRKHRNNHAEQATVLIFLKHTRYLISLVSDESISRSHSNLLELRLLIWKYRWSLTDQRAT